MTLPRSMVVAKRVLIQLRRDRRTLAMIVLQPIIIMGVFGYAFGGDVTDARVAVANLDRGTLAADVISRLDQDTVTLIEFQSSLDAEAAMRRGDASVGVIFPSNFTRNFRSTAEGDPQSLIVTILVDRSEPQLTAAVLEAFGDAVRWSLENETKRAGSFELEEKVIFGEEDRTFLQFFVPGIAAFAIFQLGSLLTVVTIVKERTLGTLPRLMASPAHRWEVVLGYASAFTVLSVAQAATILGIAAFLFRVPIQGSILLALVLTTLVGVVALGFGILVSGLATSEFQAVQGVFLLSFPNLFLAGIFAPIESMPPLVRPISKFVPLTYAVDALRDTLNRGRTLDDVLWPVAMLTLFSLLFLGAATLSFGRKV